MTKIPSQREVRAYLSKHGWKKVRGENLYVDPRSGQLFSRSHAVIVQEGRDRKKSDATALKKELKRMKEIQAMRDWDPHCERIDELYPP